MPRRLPAAGMAGGEALAGVPPYVPPVLGGGPIPDYAPPVAPEGLPVTSGLPPPEVPPEPPPLPAPSGRVRTVIGPDGRAAGLPESQLEAALARGYRKESAEEASIRQYLQKNRGLAGDAKAALMQFGNQALLGLPELISRHTSDPYDVALREAFLKDHQVASVLGGIGGFVGSLLLGGPLFRGAAKAGQVAGSAAEAVGAVATGAERRLLAKGLEEATSGVVADRLLTAGVSPEAAVALKAAAPSIARDMLRRTIAMGTESAIIGAPHTLTEAALGDKKEAAESALLTFGIGALVGGALGLVPGVRGGAQAKLGALSPDLVRAVENAPALPAPAALTEKSTGIARIADWYAFRSIAPNTASRRVIARAARTLPDKEHTVGRVMAEHGLLLGPVESHEAHFERLVEAWNGKGAEIGQYWAEISALPSKSRQIVLTTVAKLSREMRSAVLRPLTESGLTRATAREVGSVISKLEADILGVLDPVTGAVVHEGAAQRGSFQGKPLGFATLHDWAVLFDHEERRMFKALPPGAVSPVQEEMQALRVILRKGITQEAERIAADAGRADLSQAIRGLNIEYGALTAAKQGVEHYLGGPGVANMTFSLTGHGAGIGGAVVGAAAHGALGGLAGTVAAMGAHKLVADRGDMLLARLAHALSGRGVPEGLETARVGVAHVGRMLQRVPEVLGARAAAPLLTARAGARLASSDEAKGQYLELHAGLSRLAANPSAMSQAVAPLVGALQKGAPEVAAATAVQAGAQVAELLALLPRPRAAPSEPFGPKRPPRVTERDLADARLVLGVWVDPIGSLERAEVLSPIELKALGIHPALQGRLGARLRALAADPAAPTLPEHYRRKVHQIAGMASSRPALGLTQAGFTRPEAGDSVNRSSRRVHVPEVQTAVGRISER